jgi:LDH2 family malate/lactate/ureidoglycolate dehydrogenase
MFISANGSGARSGGIQRIVGWLQREAAGRFRTSGTLAMVVGMPNVGTVSVGRLKTDQPRR